jgi:hypothetical protein
VATVNINDLPIAIGKQIDDDLALRIDYAMGALVEQIKDAYRKKVKVQGGAQGSIASLTYEIKRGEKLLTAIIGPDGLGSYLANLEYGEAGISGNPHGGLFKRTKAPPIRNIYQWMKMAGYTAKEWHKDIALANKERAERQAKSRKSKKSKFDTSKPWWSTDELMIAAYHKAMYQKHYGRAGWKLIATIVEKNAERIKKFIEDGPQ